MLTRVEADLQRSTRVSLGWPEPPCALGTQRAWRSAMEKFSKTLYVGPQGRHRRRLRARRPRRRGGVAGRDRHAAVRHRQADPEAAGEGRDAGAWAARPPRTARCSGSHRDAPTHPLNVPVACPRHIEVLRRDSAGSRAVLPVVHAGRYGTGRQHLCPHRISPGASTNETFDTLESTIAPRWAHW